MLLVTPSRWYFVNALTSSGLSAFAKKNESDEWTKHFQHVRTLPCWLRPVGFRLWNCDIETSSSSRMLGKYLKRVYQLSIKHWSVSFKWQLGVRDCSLSRKGLSHSRKMFRIGSVRVWLARLGYCKNITERKNTTPVLSSQRITYSNLAYSNLAYSNLAYSNLAYWTSFRM
jgi:hypothetical protein